MTQTYRHPTLAPGDGVSMMYRSERSNKPQAVSGIVNGVDDDGTIYVLDADDRKRVITVADDEVIRGTAPPRASAFERADVGHRPIDPSSPRKLGDVVLLSPDDVDLPEFGSLPPKHERPFRLLRAPTYHRETPTEVMTDASVRDGHESAGETKTRAMCRRLFDSPGGDSLPPFSLGQREIYWPDPTGDHYTTKTYATNRLFHRFDETPDR